MQETLRIRARELLAQEQRVYASNRPRAAAAHARGDCGYFAGVPMHWMLDWPMPFPLIIERAAGARVTDIDGNELIDLCLGDTAAMFGHAPQPIVEALQSCSVRGCATMLPSVDAAAVAQLLVERFKLPQWQIATTASDANRFAIRAARAVTGRRKILVFDGCYHGAVDDTLVDLEGARTAARRSLLGQVVDLSATSVAVPFNDVQALQRALAPGDIACVLAEPVMTNCGMIRPQPGFLRTLWEVARESGTLLLMDETHTLSSGLGGYAVTHGLQPDMLVIGKAVGGGVPVSVWGLSQETADRLHVALRSRSAQGHSGIGTTLSGSALQLACLRACLEHVMTAEAYATMLCRAERLENGLARVLAEWNLPWHVTRVGARTEVVFSPEPVLNAAQARAAACEPVEQALHLAMLNRGFLLTPFHNMMLASPALAVADVERCVVAYADVVGQLAAKAVGGAT